ncbi:TonB-dependent receptor [Maribellus luteus]|uniref:TonB-dependent receptor n=1 Tax=Maribellus luteus TaxID=2305463 RepID=A0A399SVA9_9BACT|nr:TonB-dependent receptor [Maribellus luteus]RIJ45975.1 TonB-dependent receptor [Maribellus luteus]
MSGKQFILSFIFWFGLFNQGNIFAQEKIAVSGKISDAKTGDPVMYANIAFPELGIGTSSNENGEFTLRNVPPGTYNFTVTYIGYQEYTGSITLQKDVDLEIKLKQQSLGLKEVVVTAENNTGVTTSTKIGNEAINHVQATSLNEVMQLIPGNLVVNPNLKTPARISIREIGTDINSALGTAIVVDGIPFSNDGNMQQSIQEGFSSVAGTGIDLRQIAVDNIESITVDVGIPSAEQGNLTSGAVQIKTKTGGSPYRVKLQADPHTKQAYLGKGYLLSGNQGVINIDAGYTDSYGDLNRQTDRFKRVNTSAKYTNTFFRNSTPLNIEWKMDFTSSLDGKKWDPDMKAREEHFAKDKNLNTKISALWSVNKSLFKSLSFDLGVSKTWQEGYEKTLETTSTGANFFVTSLADGEFPVEYGPATYYSEVNYNGRPFDIYSKLKAKFYHQTGRLSNNVLLGTEWRTTGNNGEGRIFDPTHPPAGEGTRPRPFTDIPSLHQLSLFAEDKIDLKLGKTVLHIMAGIRMDNIQPKSFLKTNGTLAVDPRLNVSYTLINRNSSHTFRNITLRAGYGQTTKAPTLLHLYPDKHYSDYVNFNYYPDLAVVTTNVKEDTRNPELKASTSEKLEAGIDFRVNNVKARITGFYEKQEGGFILDHNFFLLMYRQYEQIAPGLHPYFVKGQGVYYTAPDTETPVAVSYEMNEKFYSYGIYRNAQSRRKRGIEYNIDFGRIEALHTSFVLNGAWLQTETHRTDAPYWNQQHYTTYNNNISTQESFVVKFPNKYGYGVVQERLNSNLSIITHIPEIRMLVTLTTQAIWYEKDWRKRYDDYQLYSLSDLRDYLGQPNLFQNEQEDEYYYYLPVSYRNYDDVEHPYLVADFQNTLAQQAIEKEKRYRFAARTLDPLFVFNIKISKEIAQRFKLSFFANNFLNIRPWELDKREGTYLRRNAEPYFGADIRMQF